jgi:hypothetical protein
MRLIKPLTVSESEFIERASNAYYRDPVGVLAVAGPDETRFYFDDDGNFDGFLIEPDEHVSIITESEDFTSAGLWTKTNVTIGAASVGPDDGATSATRVTAAGTASIEYHELAVSSTSFTLAVGAPTTMRHIEFLPPAPADPLPYFQAVGTAVASSGSSTINVPWPAHQVDDVALLVVEYTGTVPVAPGGWSALSGDLNSGGTNFTQSIIFWRRADSASMSFASFFNSSDHKIGMIITLRGCKTSGDPFAQVVTSVSATTDATKTLPSFTATAAESLVFVVASYGNDAASNATSAWANSSLSAFTTHVDGVGTTLGNGGGIIAASASFVAVGYLSGLTQSLMRSSLFVKRVTGSDPVRLYNTRDADYAEFDLDLGEVISGDGFIEPYANGWYRISATHDTGFLPSEYGFGFEFTGELLIFGANLIAGLDDIQYLLNDEPMTGDIVLDVPDANLIYSNIPEPDPNYGPEASAVMWADDITFAKDDTAIFDHNLYVSTVNSNLDDRPDEGVKKDEPTWSLIGRSNRWKAFDALRGIDFKAEHEGLIDYLIQVPGVARSFGFFGLEAGSITVEAFDGDVRVFNETYNLVNVSDITDWYQYFSVVPTRTATLVQFNLPPIPGLLLRFRVSQDGIVKLGKLIIGTEAVLGCARWGLRGTLNNTSRQERDTFGNLYIVKRRVYKTVDYDIQYKTSLAEKIESDIEDIIGVPTVFVGSKTKPTSIVYGIVNAFSPTLVGPKKSTATLRVEAV